MVESDLTTNDPTAEREKLDYGWIAGELEDIRVSMLLVTTALHTLAAGAEPQISDKLYRARAILETTVSGRLQNVFEQVFEANLARVREALPTHPGQGDAACWRAAQ